LLRYIAAGWSGAISVLPVLTPRPTRLNGFDFGTSTTGIAPNQGSREQLTESAFVPHVPEALVEDRAKVGGRGTSFLWRTEDRS
jgi:hypothetical protein